MNDQTQMPEAQGELHTPALQPPQGSLLPIVGAVTQQIGSGEHAQNSIVYRTILWSFIGGGLLSAASISISLYAGKPSPMGEIKELWSIFVPLITLALGYLFGKGR